MRTICQLSAAFQLMDSGTKEPVVGAAILVDGRRVPYVAKGDGTCVFANLLPKPHTYTITAPGYCSEEIRLPALPARFPEVVPLRYAPASPLLRKVSHFRLRFLAGDTPLANAWFRVVLQTPVGGLKLVESAKAGAGTLSLAGSFHPGMLYQRYVWPDAAEKPLFVTGFDKETGLYELADPLPVTLRSGAVLQPVWDLMTDRDGVAILPAIGLFLLREEVEFAFAWDGRAQRIVTAPPSPSLDLTIRF